MYEVVLVIINAASILQFSGYGHPAHSSLCKESPAELILLTFVWDEAASGTARSTTENGLHSWSAPRFCMGRDCLWESEEQNREHKWNSIPYIAPRCPRGSLFPKKIEENQFHPVLALLGTGTPIGMQIESNCIHQSGIKPGNFPLIDFITFVHIWIIFFSMTVRSSS